MANSKQIVYLSQAQYAELIANGTITVDGVTVTYDENDIYITPQAEPVTDVRVAGTSVAANGVANVPLAGTTRYGVVRVGGNYGLKLWSENDSLIALIGATSPQIKAGDWNYQPIVTSRQHESVYYGLAKAAGADMANVTGETVGIYPDEQKSAIQQMLGVSDLIATAEPTLVASKAYAVGDIFTANGKLYKVTTVIAADGAIVLQNDGETISGANAVQCKLGEETIKDVQVNGVSVVVDGIAKIPKAASGVRGTVKLSGSYGIQGYGSGDNEVIGIIGATDTKIKQASDGYCCITPLNQHKSVFYGLAKAAGSDMRVATGETIGTYPDEAKAAIKSMIGVNVDDVQINGTSIVSSGIANIPIASNDGTTLGVVSTHATYGINRNSSGRLYIQKASSSQVKAGAVDFLPIVPMYQHEATFYGLAKASGDTTQSSSSNAVGTYTDNAKASIKAMLGVQDGSTGTVDITGTTPTITAVENTRYVCGEVTSLNFTPAASGICIVRFTSGSTVTVLTLPSTVKFPEWFDSTSLETNTIYEICITDGIYGAVMSWAL